jgi:exonuclease SbcC
MIILQKIKLNNFLSHTQTEIDFKSEQKVLLDGKSGSGKSSLVEAILWCLYGRGRSDNRSLIKRGAKKASVVVVLQDEEKKYVIERSIDSKSKHEITVTENDIPIKVKGTRETQEYIERKILHASYILFTNSIVYPQENFDNFVNQTAGKRKDILLEIINAADYDEYLEKTKKELQKIKTKQEVVLSKIEGKRDNIKNNQNIANDLDKYEKEEEHLKHEIENLKKQYTEMTTKEKQVAENLIIIKNQEEKKETKARELRGKVIRNDELNKKIIELSNINIEIIKKELNDLNEIKIKIKEYDDAKEKLMIWNNQLAIVLGQAPTKYDYQTEISVVNKQLIDLLNDTTDKCPKCGYIDLGREQKRKDTINTLEGRIKALQVKIEVYTKDWEEYNTKLTDLGTQPELPMPQEQYLELKEKINNLDELNKKLINAENFETQKAELMTELELNKADQKDLNDEIKKIEAEIIKKDSLYQEERQLKDDIIKINGKIDELMIFYTGNNQLLGIAKHAAKQIEQCKIELETLQKDLDKDGELLESLELLKDAFGPNGLKAIVVDYILPQLEDKINNILGKLSDFRVRLETQKDGIGEDVIIEGLFITIINDVGEELDFANFSGGEKVKISVAINEALAEVSKVGFRILDETIVALDSDSVQNFIIAMDEILLKVKQVICISHIPEIKNMFDEKIIVTKVNGDSKINI